MDGGWWPYKLVTTAVKISILFPGQTRAVFKWRSKTLDLKCHSTYKYDDELSRKFGTCNETAEHVVNCNQDHIEVVDISALDISTDDVMDRLHF